MALKLRVQYPGAIYRAINRGDRREAIFSDDRDRECCDYVRPNPVRATLLTQDQGLEEYSWSSYPCYLKEPESRPTWPKHEGLWAKIIRISRYRKNGD